MYFLSIAIGALAGVAYAQHDPDAPLTKPPLVPSITYLEPGLVANLPQTSYTLDQWAYGSIPQGCKDVAQGKVEPSIGYDPRDFEMFDVHYLDCGDSWIFCHHRNSNVTIDSMAAQFGKLPVQMRQWIRHVVDVPADKSWSFEYDGTITFVSPVNDMLTAIIHETGHSLDLNNAYADKPLSSSENWWNNYELDSNVPDEYAQSNAREDVAQNTIVAVFNENYPGGYAAFEPKWRNVFYQYATLITEASIAGAGNNLFVPGQNQPCIKHMPSTQAVSMDSTSGKRLVRRRGNKKHAGYSLT